MSEHYDIVIVGGGIVGATLALALAQKTALKIALIEAKSEMPAWAPEHYHHRVSAITLASQRIFSALNVWEAVKSKRFSPFHAIEVWEENNKAHAHFDSQFIQEKKLGYIIENNLLQLELQKKLQTTNVKWLAPLQLQSVEMTSDYAKLIAANGQYLTTRLVIAADGANSFLRRAIHIPVTRVDYQQNAIVTTVRTEKSHQQIARQVFLQSGPLAFLPLADAHLCSIVWTLPTETAHENVNIPAADFCENLTQAFSAHLGKVLETEARFSFPLYQQRAAQYIKSRIALVGDAAHVIHPLAGQGVNMGLLDAASLVDVVTTAINNRRDFASYATLRRYERWRKAENIFLQKGVHLLNQFPELRAFGLNKTQKSTWLNAFFIKHAVGMRTKLPNILLPR